MTNRTEHHTAPQQPQNLEAFMKELGGYLNDISSLRSLSDPAVQDVANAYFGNCNQHPSMARLDELEAPVTNDLPPIARLTGLIHGIFRYDLFKDMDVTLDRARLQPHTKQTLEDLDGLIKRYRRAVNATRSVESEKLLDDGKLFRKTSLPNLGDMQDIEAYNEQATTLYKQITASELGDTRRNVPVIMNGKPQSIRNRSGTGLFLALYPIIQGALLDLTRIPESLSTLLEEDLGKANELIAALNDKTAAGPLRNQRDYAYEMAYLKTCALIQPAIHDLQMVSLLGNTKSGSGEAAENLLAMVNAPPYPSRLNNAAEMAMTLQVIVEDTFFIHDSMWTPIDNLAQIYAKGKTPDIRDVRSAKFQLKRLSENLPEPLIDTDVNHQDTARIKLTLDYLDRKLGVLSSKSNQSLSR